MTTTRSKSGRTFVWLLCLQLLVPVALVRASTINWNVVITPKNSGSVFWCTDSPVNSGTLTKSGKITFNKYSYVDLTFQPNTGGSIVKIMKNTDDWTSSLDVNHHYQFGPVDSAHVIVAQFSGGTTPVVDPTGAFGFSFPTNNPLLTAITDISGTHTGTTATVSATNPRLYSVDIAQDESGKLSAMGTVTGITNSAGNNQLAGTIGAITTVNNQPTAQLKGKFEGTIDGAATTASGSGQGPVAVSDIGGGTNGVTGTGSGSAKVAGVPYSAPNTPLKLPAPNAASHIHKSWWIVLTITNTASASAKSAIMASAILKLPNDDQIEFPAKKTKYSAKGYSLSFKSGTNTTSHVVDKKTKVSIKGMTLNKPSGSPTYEPTAGTMSYQFLGQKGKGNLMDFLTP